MIKFIVEHLNLGALYCFLNDISMIFYTIKNKILRKIEKIEDKYNIIPKILIKWRYINMLKKDYKCYYLTEEESQHKFQ